MSQILSKMMNWLQEPAFTDRVPMERILMVTESKEMRAFRRQWAGERRR